MREMNRNLNIRIDEETLRLLNLMRSVYCSDDVISKSAFIRMLINVEYDSNYKYYHSFEVERR